MTKLKLPLISEIKVDKKKLISNFKDIRNIGNFKMLKCFHLLFDKNNILKNSANYLVLINFTVGILAIFTFIFYNNKKMKKYLEQTTNNLNLNNNEINNIIKKDKVTYDKEEKIKETNIDNIRLNCQNITNKKKLNRNFNQYNDKEINSLDYIKAKKIDKRTYFQYYISLIKTNHILIFSFYLISDYNSQIIKIYLFFYNFMINYTVSAMFYSDDTIHKIYIDKGLFDFTYQLPQIIYSFIISSILTNLLNFLGLYEGDIIEMKKNKKNNENNKKIFIIKFKIFLFFIITYVLLFFIWLYLGCFCAVYKNTQIHLFKDVISSFAFSLLTPFFICLLPGLLRIPSLKSKSERTCLYKFSKFLQVF